MELIQTLRRHWILTISLLLLTLVGTVGALFALPWKYQSQSTVVLLPPTSASKIFGNNPYMAIDSTITLAGDVLRHDMASPRVASSLAARGYSASYVVTQAIDTNGPILLVTITGPSKATAQHTLSGVTDEMSSELNRLQAGTRPGNQIRDTVIAMSPQATRLVSKKAKPLLVVLGLGLALTIAIPVIVDAQLARRRTRKENDITYPKGVDRPVEQVAYSPTETYGRREPVHYRTGVTNNGKPHQAAQHVDEVDNGFDSDRPANVNTQRTRPVGRLR